MKLTKDHLLPMWKAGRITGFINKAKAHDDLLRATTGIGTFLLRFSDSELGTLTLFTFSNMNSLHFDYFSTRRSHHSLCK